jgi:alkylation response protein AidB-like acyl-CoA dehydrogenase
MVATTAIGLPAGFLPDEAVATIFDAGRIPPAAIAILPTGVATPVDGGYRLTGRWPFASGVRHAEWLTAGAVVRRHADDPGERFIMVIPAAARSARQLEGGGARGHGQLRRLGTRLLRACRVRLESGDRYAEARRGALPARHARVRRV